MNRAPKIKKKEREEKEKKMIIRQTRFRNVILHRTVPIKQFVKLSGRQKNWKRSKRTKHIHSMQQYNREHVKHIPILPKETYTHIRVYTREFNSSGSYPRRIKFQVCIKIK